MSVHDIMDQLMRFWYLASMSSQDSVQFNKSLCCFYTQNIEDAEGSYEHLDLLDTSAWVFYICDKRQNLVCRPIYAFE